MNKITRFVNWLDKMVAPLGELVKDENFRGQLLADSGLREKSSPEGKAKTQEKLNVILRMLDAFRKKLGLDKSDIPNVSNLAGLAVVLIEAKAVYDAMHELLLTTEYNSKDGVAYTQEDQDQAINNAMRAVLRFLTQNAFRKASPETTAIFEAMGAFSDELNEVYRALDLLLFPILTLLKNIDNNINPDFFRPLGDTASDDRLRITKGMFLISSISSLFIPDAVKAIGTFLFSFGQELPTAKDAFPNAGKIADRTMLMQFIPGDAFTFDDDDPYPVHIRKPASTDLIVSFSSIPVLPVNAGLNTNPEGFQYLLGFEINPGDAFGSTAGGFTVRFPKNFNQYFLWGHNTDFHSFNPGILNSRDPLVSVEWKKNKEVDPEDANNISGGDVLFNITPLAIQTATQKSVDAELSLQFKNVELSVSGKGRDGFLQKILPESSAAKINFNLKITYSTLRNKWTFEGLENNNGLLFSFKVDKTVFGKLEIPLAYIGLKPYIDENKEMRGVSLESAAVLKLMLGPFSMTVDRIGLALALKFPKEGPGNIGMADLDLGLKPPSGIGFLVKASIINGGGFLNIDPENHQYYGVGELNINFKDKYILNLKVIAIILTQLPDGKKGYSFLLLASIEFTPEISTPLGFKIKGVGVLVAMHRTMNTDAFREAIRDDRFNSILFPYNPVGNAPTIIKSLNTLFPAAEGHYVFGIMARIGWGTKNLVDLKLGLLLEFSSSITPNIISLVGVLKVAIDVKSKRVVNLQVNFLVALELEKKMLSVDAAVYNSKIIFFDIMGEMYLRYRWGQDPVFLISIGGWHPDFQVPAGLKLPAKPVRVTIPLIDKKNLSLVLSCYLAVTSNTVQAGFEIDFKLRWSKFRLEAGLSMDALFHFNPFYFIVDFEGKLRIYWGSSRLAGVSVKGRFSGTHPWRIKGKATFEIWIWDYDVDFDESTGEELTAITQEVDVLPLFEQAIRDKANWQTSLPPGLNTHVMLRKIDNDTVEAPSDAAAASTILADPLSRLEVMQQVAPLGIRIDKLGFQKAKNFRKFDLVPDSATGQAVESGDLNDFFAPAMFLEIKDAEKLSRKSFESMRSGRSFGDIKTVSCGTAQITPFDYDTKIYNPEVSAASTSSLSAPAPSKFQLTVSELHFQHWAANNSVARSAEGRKAKARKEIDARKATMKTDAFILTDAITGIRITEVEGQQSMTNAYYEMWKFNQVNTTRKIKVVRESELII